MAPFYSSALQYVMTVWHWDNTAQTAQYQTLKLKQPSLIFIILIFFFILFTAYFLWNLCMQKKREKSREVRCSLRSFDIPWLAGVFTVTWKLSWGRRHISWPLQVHCIQTSRIKVATLPDSVIHTQIHSMQNSFTKPSFCDDFTKVPYKKKHVFALWITYTMWNGWKPHAHMLTDSTEYSFKRKYIFKLI